MSLPDQETDRSDPLERDRAELARWSAVLRMSQVLLGVIALAPMAFGAFVFIEDADSTTDDFHGLGMMLGGLSFVSGAVPVGLVLLLRWWLRSGTEHAAAGDPRRLRAAGVAHIVGAGVPLVLVLVSSIAGTVLPSGDPAFGILYSVLGLISLAWCVLFAVAGWKVRRLAAAAAPARS